LKQFASIHVDPFALTTQARRACFISLWHFGPLR
jgi:hypothetical protein